MDNTIPSVNSISAIWANQPGDYFCLSTRRKELTKGGLKNHWFEAYQFHLVEDKIKELRDTHNVWFCPHGFKRRIRREKYAEPSHFLYADCDGVDPRGAKLPPIMVIQSSPGRYNGFWYVGEPVPKEVNQAWTKLHGYDPGGWDPTQVLRVPKGRNHKYVNKPFGKVIAVASAKHSLAKFEKLLPKLASTAVDNSLADFWDKLKPEMRRELTSGAVIEGERSHRIWHMAHALTDAGASIDQAAAAILQSPCGQSKFQGTKALERVKRQVRKALKTKTPSTGRDAPQVDKQIEIRTPQESDAKPIDWLWKYVLALGKITILYSPPGDGKSLLSCKMTAHVTNGRKWPDGSECPQGNVFILNGEDDQDDTITPRLTAAGANFDYVRYVSLVREGDHRRLFDLAKDLNDLKGKDIRLLIIDPITAYLGKTNSYNNAEVRALLTMVKTWAEDNRCAVLIISHPKKSDDGSLDSLGGSAAFGAAPRFVYRVIRNPIDHDERILIDSKRNIGPVKKGISFDVKEMRLSAEIETSMVKWRGPTEITIEESFGRGRPPRPREEAMEFLKETLANGPRSIRAVETEAEARGHKGSLRRAKETLKLKTVVVKGENCWELRS